MQNGDGLQGNLHVSVVIYDNINSASWAKNIFITLKNLRNADTLTQRVFNLARCWNARKIDALDYLQNNPVWWKMEALELKF